MPTLLLAHCFPTAAAPTPARCPACAAGQLVGSLVAAALARSPLLSRGDEYTTPSLLPLLLSAALIEAAGQCVLRFHAQGGGSLPGSCPESPGKPARQQRQHPPPAAAAAAAAAALGLGLGPPSSRRGSPSREAVSQQGSPPGRAGSRGEAGTLDLPDGGPEVGGASKAYPRRGGRRQQQLRAVGERVLEGYRLIM